MSYDQANATSLVEPMPYRHPWITTALLTVCYAFSVIDRKVMAYLVTDIKHDLGLSDLTLGILQGFAFSIFYALAAIPLGLAADRVVRKRLIAGGLVIWSLMTVLCGMAKSTATLVVSRFGVGSGEAALTPAAYSMMADMLPARSLPIGMGIYTIGSVIATGGAAAFSGLVLGHTDANGQILLPIVGHVLAWRAVFVLAGTPGLLLAALMLMIREPRRGISKSHKQESSQDALLDFLRKRKVTHVSFAVVMALTTLANYAIISWNPSILVRTYGWSPARIGSVLSTVTLAGGLIGCLCSAWIPSYLIKRGKQHRLVGMIIVFTLLLGVTGALAPLTGSAVVFIALTLISASAAPCLYTLGPTILQMTTPSQLRGRMSAIYMLLSVGGGAGAGPTLVGAMSTYVFQGQMALSHALSSVVAAATLIVLICLRLIAPRLRHSLA